MPTRGSQDRPQTIKQAKAAFKAREPTSVSAAERRRLERGAELLERASRIKEQEQRKKSLLKKKETSGTKLQQNQKPVLLGTQRKLDKFGYKSSQFHLGAFLNAARPSVEAKNKARSPEPCEDETVVDDDTLLNVAQSPVRQTESKLAGRDATRMANAAVGTTLIENRGSPSSSTEDEFGEWDDFFESSTQLARQLTNGEHDSDLQSPPAELPATALQFSSFGSTDFDLSVEDLEDLERQAASRIASHSRTMPPPPKPGPGQSTGRTRTQTAGRRPQCSISLSSQQAPKSLGAREKALHDISLADLESLAGEEIELSQCPRV